MSSGRVTATSPSCIITELPQPPNWANWAFCPGHAGLHPEPLVLCPTAPLSALWGPSPGQGRGSSPGSSLCKAGFVLQSSDRPHGQAQSQESPAGRGWGSRAAEEAGGGHEHGQGWAEPQAAGQSWAWLEFIVQSKSRVLHTVTMTGRLQKITIIPVQVK